jgi:hypothetical protein
LRERWWIYGEARNTFRPALVGIETAIATSLTAKHRVFVHLDSKSICDSTTVMFALPGAQYLGVLSSRVHVLWSLSAGGRLGVGNDSRYNKKQCFETFPFPILTGEAHSKFAKLAEAIDNHRKTQQAQHSDLTLTGMYNVLEKLRSGEELTNREKTIHEQGFVSVLRELHDDLDRAVFQAYGWSDLADKLVGRPGATTPLPDTPADQAQAEEELLMRLVDLNKQRAEEESRGSIRWLRPDYQAPDVLQTEVDIAPKVAKEKSEAATSKGKGTFPKAIPDQLRVLREALAERSHTTESLAEMFKRKPMKSVEEGLQSLVAVGVAEYDPETQTWHTV